MDVVAGRIAILDTLCFSETYAAVPIILIDISVMLDSWGARL